MGEQLILEEVVLQTIFFNEKYKGGYSTAHEEI